MSTTADRLRDQNVCIPLSLGRLAADELDAITALLPDCPVCGGTGKGAPGITVDGEKSWAHCPDCVDGKVTVAQMAALWQAVHGDGMMVERPRSEWHQGHNDVLLTLRALRSVRP